MFKFKVAILAVLSSLLFTKKAISQDWANLGKYQEANKKIAVLKPNEQRVVFMGNSITEGMSKAFFKGKNFFSKIYCHCPL